MLARVMAGDAAALRPGLRAYVPGLRLVDRQRQWDSADLMPAIAFTMLERWDELAPHLHRVDMFAQGGGALARAVAAAVREEAAAAEGGPAPQHAELAKLGFAGLSRLLRVRHRVTSAP